ncbi:MAG: LysR family transcriptional regulator substrate-binding protein [Clostridiales Family XIII bacterium]|nr:LysR family transcriptional regulator substrate-binding protein [Clostridiales Family XIII bacterium]
MIKLLNSIITRLETIDIKEAEELELVSGAFRGEYEMIVIREEILPENKFRKYPILREKAVAMLRINHKLANSGKIRLIDLRDENFILMDKLTAPYKIFYGACLKAGFEPNIVLAPRIESIIISNVREGEGISLMFESDTEAETFNFKDICLVPLEDEVTSRIVLAAPKSAKVSRAEKILARELHALHTGTMKQ